MSFLSIGSLFEVFSKFKFSWILTIFLGVFSETLLPLFSQMFVLVIVQLFGVFLDYIRERYLGKKKKDERIS